MKVSALLLICVAATLSSCSEKTSAEPQIEFGVDACDHCRMIVSDRPYAAAAFLESGRLVRFDDIGCMVEWLNSNGVKSAWVVDFSGGKWLEARSAYFVQSDAVKTPMASGIAAFAEQIRAEEKARAHNAKVVSWEILRTKK